MRMLARTKVESVRLDLPFDILRGSGYKKNNQVCEKGPEFPDEYIKTGR